MPKPVVLETERLILRPWREEDYSFFAVMSCDPKVMEFLTPLPGRAASDALADHFAGHIKEKGWGFWVMADKARGIFMGVLGLHTVRPDMPFAPGVEIGWRLARPFWGRGYATEGARAAVEFGFAVLALREIVAYAVPSNIRSRAVMERLGMRLTDIEFDHPLLPPGHHCRRHCLYRIGRSEWAEQGQTH